MHIVSIWFIANSKELEIWDANQEDGDEISIIKNNKVILKNYKILNNKKHLTIKLDAEITNIKLQLIVLEDLLQIWLK
nr:hypothetical protein [uncultured Flavobacterium sp.]